MHQKESRFENDLRAAPFDDQPNTAHRDKLEERLHHAWERQTSKSRREPAPIWRTIMRSRVTKLATSAAAAAALIVGVYLFTNPPGGGNVAWAIEQSVQAHSQVKSAYATGACTDRLLLGDKGGDEPHKFELWARLEESGRTSGRFARGDGLLIVVRENTSYVYYPPEDRVYITDGERIAVKSWFDGSLLQTLKEKAQNLEITYGPDEETGRQSAFVKGTSDKSKRSWWCQFDMETKLLMRLKEWPNTKREGVPTLEIRDVVYDKELKDDLFRYAIPKGAKVRDKRKKSAATKPATGSEPAGR